MMGYGLQMELPMVKDNEARYVAVFDPTHGSKNIDASLPVGTIFSISARISSIRIPNMGRFTASTRLIIGATGSR